MGRSKDPADLEHLRTRAIRAVTRREHGAEELRNKLVRGGAPADVARELVTEFTRRGWQSDDRYAQALARQRIHQGYGPLRIRAELIAAGIADHLADLVSQAPEDGHWLGLARASLARRFPTPPSNAAEWQKAWRFLAQRGFPSDLIREVLKHRSDTDDGIDG